MVRGASARVAPHSDARGILKRSTRWKRRNGTTDASRRCGDTRTGLSSLENLIPRLGHLQLFSNNFSITSAHSRCSRGVQGVPGTALRQGRYSSVLSRRIPLTALFNNLRLLHIYLTCYGYTYLIFVFLWILAADLWVALSHCSFCDCWDQMLQPGNYSIRTPL